MAIKKGNTRISITLPEHVVEEIDQHIAKQYITRTKWFIDAAKDKIEKDTKDMVNKIVHKK